MKRVFMSYETTQVPADLQDGDLVEAIRLGGPRDGDAIGYFCVRLRGDDLDLEPVDVNVSDIRDDVAEWAFARRDFDRRGDELLLLAQSVMDEGELLEALNLVVKDFHYDRYEPQELRKLLLAIKSRRTRLTEWLLEPTEDDEAGLA